MDKQKILFTALSTEELSEIMENSVKNAIGDYEISKPGEDQLLNARQAAKLINYQRPTLYGLVRQDKIPYSKTAGKLLFSRNKLLQWVGQYKDEPKHESPPQ
ncbi:DNA-binding protein [Pedobacter frigidisoli]|uniref:DNA-binding protein n=1 Tax=Pedobacter frigidisoli TaxID=2530455 RepID=A0A4R0NH20_9SPHI|nr:helix-turn-helix domain-containing protein [Pedobacter frigidisoli]TCC99755.1 DNA-binding protein [Pedobacter frigidisoli]